MEYKDINLDGALLKGIPKGQISIFAGKAYTGKSFWLFNEMIEEHLMKQKRILREKKMKRILNEDMG